MTHLMLNEVMVHGWCVVEDEGDILEVNRHVCVLYCSDRSENLLVRGGLVSDDKEKDFIWVSIKITLCILLFFCFHRLFLYIGLTVAYNIPAFGTESIIDGYGF